MPAKMSTGVSQRQRSCMFVLTALYRQGGEIAEKLHATTEPHLRPGDQAPEFLATVVALGRRLETALERLLVEDDNVYDASARLGRRYKEQQAVMSTVGQMVSRLRRGLLSQFKKPRLDGLGIEARNPRQPVMMLRLAERMLKSFERDDLEERLGEPFFAQAFDPRAQAAEIAPAVDELRRALRRIDEARRDLDRAVTAKKRVQKEYDVLFLHTARTFETFCRLAGENELADRVRPSVRRPGQTRQKLDAEDGKPERQKTRSEETGAGDESTSPADSRKRPTLVPVAAQAI